MNIKHLMILISLFIGSQVYAQTTPMQGFLRSCAWGTAIGAGAGVVSLAFSEEPSKNLNNIARGASLGLYAGIVLGLVEMNRTQSSHESSTHFWISPQIEKEKASGLQANLLIFGF